MPVADPIALGEILTAVGGGLALFLYGMRKMSDSVSVAAGDALQKILKRCTKNPLTGMLTGAGVTAVVQSSSVTTVLAVGFVSAGLMSFSQSIGVIMGANVGTTITAQIVALKVTDYALPMIAIGFLIEVTAPARLSRLKHIGVMIMGLGMLFFGMALMSDATKPLRSYQPFIQLMADMRSPLTGVLAGAAFTAIVQSSSATTGIVIVLAGSGLVSLEAGIALALGANLGTCATAMLAALGKSREAVRVAVVHVLFNGVGVLIWMPFIWLLGDVSSWMSPVSDVALSGTEKLASEVPRQIANSHTVFNIFNALLMVGFTKPLAGLVMKLVPDKKVVDKCVSPLLDPLYLSTPAMAIAQSAQEVGEIGALLVDVKDDLFAAAITHEAAAGARMQEMWDNVHRRHRDVVGYMRDISLQDLVGDESGQLQQLLTAVNCMHTIAGVMATDMWQAVEDDFQISEETQEALRPLHELTMVALQRCVDCAHQQDPEVAEELTLMKSTVKAMRADISAHLLVRLQSDGPRRIHAFRRESGIAEDYQRIFILCRRLAKAFAKSNGDEESA